MEFDLPKISHEFGNLLTLVVGAYQVIGSRHPELGSEDYWDTMGADLNSMRNLLGTLRGITPELTAQSSGEHQKNFASVKQERYDPVIAAHGKTICQVCEETERSIRVLCEQRKICFEYLNRITEYEAPIVKDVLAMKLTLLNLCKKAVEACEPGDRIELRLELLQESGSFVRTDCSSNKDCGMKAPGSGMVQITVSDSGVSIPVCVREHMFEQGYTTKAAGTGCGLAVVREQMEAIGGTVVYSENRGNKSFILRF